MSERDDNIKRIISLMQRDDSVDAPPEAIRWAKNLFRTGRAAAPQKSSGTLVERIRAVLRIDLAAGRPAPGERSAAADVRQMFFEAGPNSIDLRISKAEDGFRISGQILGDEVEEAVVRFGDFTVRTNDLGEFDLGIVPPGRYDLTVSSATREILIEEIELT